MLTNSSLGGLLPVLVVGQRVSNFCPGTHWTSPVASAVNNWAPVVVLQSVVARAVKQFQSVSLAPSVVPSTVMLPSPDSKLLGLPLTTIPAPIGGRDAATGPPKATRTSAAAPNEPATRANLRFILRPPPDTYI